MISGLTNFKLEYQAIKNEVFRREKAASNRFDAALSELTN